MVEVIGSSPIEPTGSLIRGQGNSEDGLSIETEVADRRNSPIFFILISDGKNYNNIS